MFAPNFLCQFTDTVTMSDTEPVQVFKVRRGIGSDAEIVQCHIVGTPIIFVIPELRANAMNQHRSPLVAMDRGVLATALHRSIDQLRDVSGPIELLFDRGIRQLHLEEVLRAEESGFVLASAMLTEHSSFAPIDIASDVQLFRFSRAEWRDTVKKIVNPRSVTGLDLGDLIPLCNGCLNLCGIAKVYKTSSFFTQQKFVNGRSGNSFVCNLI